jgi:hypothetical protein
MQHGQAVEKKICSYFMPYLLHSDPIVMDERLSRIAGNLIIKPGIANIRTCF